MEIKLTGTNAIIATIAVVGFLVFRFNMQTEALQTEGVERIKNWLVLESARDVLPDMKEAMQISGQNAGYLEQMADNLKEENFEVTSVTRRGTGERIVARVEVNYKGAVPSEGMNVRYLRMNYSMVTGWRVDRETSKWNYYLASF